MPLIRCPECGHAVLSVASSCPNCSHLLAQNPMQAGEASALSECPRCGKYIERAATSCVYCGYPVRRWRLVRSTALTVITLAVVASATVVWSRRTTGGTTATDQPRPPTTPIVVPSPPTTPPIVASPPPADAPDAEAPIPPPVVEPRPATPSSARESRSGHQVRWAATWINVRERRGTTSPIVLILTPGSRVEVADSFSGWWAVYRDGERIGFAFAGLLAADSTVRLDIDSLD